MGMERRERKNAGSTSVVGAGEHETKSKRNERRIREENGVRTVHREPLVQVFALGEAHREAFLLGKGHQAAVLAGRPFFEEVFAQLGCE